MQHHPPPVHHGPIASHAKAAPRAATPITTTGQVTINGVVYDMTVTLAVHTTPTPVPPPPPGPGPVVTSIQAPGGNIVSATPAGARLVLLGANLGQPGQIIFKSPTQTLSAGIFGWTDTRIDLAVPIPSSFPLSNVWIEIRRSTDTSATIVTQRFEIDAPVPTAAGPVINGIVDDAGQPVVKAIPDEHITVLGSGFGSATGRLVYNSVDLLVQSWSDTKIQAIVNAPAVPAGYLSVTDSLGNAAAVRSFTVEGP